MNKFIEKVTVTGADDSIDPAQLLDLLAEFPFVEFGILLSRGGSGRNRFPSKEWLDSFATTMKGKGVSVAGHICGDWVKEIYQGVWPWEEISGALSGVIQRWQLNTHGIHHDCNLDAFMDGIRRVNKGGQQIIFQYDKVNVYPIMVAANQGLNVSALFDLSHGAGVLPAKWEYPADPKTGEFISVPCGFAGGLSPENVVEQIRQIENVVEQIRQIEGMLDGKNIWIDVETKLRSAGDRQFDIEKVRSFLEKASPWCL